MGYATGFSQGKEVSKNPFAILLNSIGEGMARRRSEDKKRADEENELRQEIIKLGAKSEYDTVLMKATEEEKRKTEKEKSPEAIVDKQGNIIGYRPVGSVFQPSASLDEIISNKIFPEIKGKSQTTESGNIPKYNPKTQKLQKRTNPTTGEMEYRVIPK